jgi:hypothetical protein
MHDIGAEAQERQKQQERQAYEGKILFHDLFPAKPQSAQRKAAAVETVGVLVLLAIFAPWREMIFISPAFCF